MTETLPPVQAAPDELWAHLARVERRVRQAVDRRRAADPNPDDPHRGLYLTPEAVDRVLSAGPTPPGEVPGLGDPAPDGGGALARLAGDFGLGALDVELLLVALAPDLDVRFEQLYGYLNDDVTRRRPTVGLALELHGLPAAGPARFRLAPDAPLVAGGLVEVLESERPALSRTLRVPDRVLAHLLGHDRPDPALSDLVRLDPGSAHADPRVVTAIEAGVRLVHLRHVESPSAGPAAAALTSAGRPALVVDAPALAAAPEALPALVREARLRGAGIAFGPVEAVDPARARLLRDLVARAEAVPLICYGSGNWDPGWAGRAPVPITLDRPPPESRAADWRRELPGAPDPVVAALTGFRLGVEQVRAAASVATELAMLDRRPVDLPDLRAGVRAQNGAGLERLARRIAPDVGWDDLVLPDPTKRHLAELAMRVRHRDTVLGRWRMRPGGGRGRGVMALFAGESGTGKTMSAEVVAAELGMDLYVVDLSTVVDKYVGETEKNLERIFTEAVGVNGVLLFDEADAIFGKRSAVQDAHDRYANVESAYLLQRMESFDGVAILTTNLRANLDDAFTRRLDVIADFPMPDPTQRLALWDRCLGPALPRTQDVDLPFCAARFELAGGSIRACAVTAAYLAAEAGGPLTMTQVMAAINQEYRKLGRLIRDGEFGPWLQRKPSTT